MRVSVGRGREKDERKVLRERVKPSGRRLLAQQTVVGAVLGCGKKVVAMWQLPQLRMIIFENWKKTRTNSFLEMGKSSSNVPNVFNGSSLTGHRVRGC